MKKFLWTILVVFVAHPFLYAGGILDKIDANIEMTKEIKSQIDELKKLVQTTPASSVDERKIFLKGVKKNCKKVKKLGAKLMKKNFKIITAVKKLEVYEEYGEFGKMVLNMEEFISSFVRYYDVVDKLPKATDSKFLKKIESCGDTILESMNYLGEFDTYLHKLRKKIAASNAT